MLSLQHKKIKMDSIILNMDCLQYMQDLPDKLFDLTIADPPYGIGKDWEKRKVNNKYNTTYTNNEKLDKIYFDEIKRVSKNYIIFGWNYYTDILGPTNYLIIWDKLSNNTAICFSKCELAATNIPIPANIIRVLWDGWNVNEEEKIKKIHPHQRPVELYRKILQQYTTKNDTKIFDPFAGSQSCRIACKQLGYDYVGCETDKYFYTKGNERFERIIFDKYVVSNKTYTFLKLDI